MTGIHAKLRRKTLAFLGSLLVLTICACICGGEDTSVWLEEPEAPDLVGIWEAHYPLDNGVEVLVFREDGTYQQAYENREGYLYVSDWSEWTISRAVNGRVWVYLEGGRWFPEGPEVAALEGMDPLRPNDLHHFYDPATNGSITMQNRLILTTEPWHTARGFVLVHFAFDIDSGTEHFEPVAP